MRNGRTDSRRHLFSRSLRCTASSNSPSRQRSGHGLQVGRQHSPAHPASKTFLAFLPAPSQLFPPLPDPAPPSHSSPKPPCPLVPSLPLILLSLGALVARFGQAHLLYSHLFC